MKLKNVIFLILFFWIGNTVAKTGYYDSMSLSFGMVNHSVTENESTLAKTDNTETSATEAKEAAKAWFYCLFSEYWMDWGSIWCRKENEY